MVWQSQRVAWGLGVGCDEKERRDAACSPHQNVPLRCTDSPLAAFAELTAKPCWAISVTRDCGIVQSESENFES